MTTRAPLAPHEWYHCYNRGVDRRAVFQSAADYDRFVALLFLCNGTKNVHLSNRQNTDLRAVFENDAPEKGNPLVEIAAYSLMPNHVHLVLRSSQEKGIALFMQKIFTAYTMYFNKRRHRTGALFAGSYKSKHIHDDRYFKRLVPYVLLNAADIVEPQWRENRGPNRVAKNILEYPYSSLPDFYGSTRLQRKVINNIEGLYETKPSLAQMLKEARRFYRDNEKELSKL